MENYDADLYNLLYSNSSNNQNSAAIPMNNMNSNAGNRIAGIPMNNMSNSNVSNLMNSQNSPAAPVNNANANVANIANNQNMAVAPINNVAANANMPNTANMFAEDGKMKYFADKGSQLRQPKTAFPADTPVGMAYVPYQMWEKTYDCNIGFARGTIFPSLDKPFIGEEAVPNERKR